MTCAHDLQSLSLTSLTRVTYPAAGGDLQRRGSVDVLQAEQLPDDATHGAPVKVLLRIPVVERQLGVPGGDGGAG